MTNTTRRGAVKRRSMRALVPAAIAAGTVALLVSVQAQSAQAVDSATVQSLASTKVADAKALSRPIASCITMRGTKDASSPIFNGCIDWHSAVHGHGSLYALARVTGDASLAQPAENRISNSSAVTSELQYMRRTTVGKLADNPYGFAWFLRLAADRERVTKNTSLRPLASFAASQIAAMPSRVSVRADNYQNSSWAVLNLAEWAKYTNDAALQSTAASLSNSIKSASCPVQNDTGSASEFIPPCLMRVAAVATVEGAQARAWVDQQMPKGFNVPVLPNTGSDHSMAQNFYRAFALARIGNMTGRTDLVDNAAVLTKWQIANPQVWTTNYPSWSHWIAQVGVLAQQEVVAPVTANFSAVSANPPVAPAAGTNVNTTQQQAGTTSQQAGTTTQQQAGTTSQQASTTTQQQAGTTSQQAGTTSTRTGVTSTTSGGTRVYTSSGTVQSSVVPKDQLAAAQQQVDQQIAADKALATSQLQAQMQADAQAMQKAPVTVTSSQQTQQYPAVATQDTMLDDAMDDDSFGAGDMGGGSMGAGSIWQQIMSWFQSWSM